MPPMQMKTPDGRKLTIEATNDAVHVTVGGVKRTLSLTDAPQAASGQKATAAPEGCTFTQTDKQGRRWEITFTPLDPAPASRAPGAPEDQDDGDDEKSPHK